MTILSVAIAAGALLTADPITPERVMEIVRALPARRAGAGDAADRAGLREAEGIVEARLRALGYEVEREPLRWAKPHQPKEGAPAGPEEFTFHNLIVEKRGTDLAGEVIVLGAHLDAVPGTPGADDNASGVAGLLEIARVVRAEPTRRTLRLCFFTLEEVGLVGSRQHVQRRRGARDAAGPGGPAPERVVGMASLEMLGYFSDAPGSQKSPIARVEGVFEPRDVGDSIVVIGLARDAAWVRLLCDAMATAEPELPVSRVDFLPVPIPDMMRSDHAPFVISGIPGVMVTDTANFRNPHYHRPTDTPETLDPVRLARVVRALAAATLAGANPPETARDALRPDSPPPETPIRNP